MGSSRASCKATNEFSAFLYGYRSYNGHVSGMIIMLMLHVLGITSLNLL